MCLYIYVWILLHKPTRHRQFLDWFLTNTVFKKKHKLYIFSATEPRKSSPNKNVCFTRLLSGMEGLLWLIVQPVCSQRYRACRAVRYNLTQNTFPPSDRRFLTVQLPPSVPLDCFIPHSVTVTYVFQLCDWSDNERGSSVIAGAHSREGAAGCTPTHKIWNPKHTDVDLMKLQVLGDFL